MLWSRALAVGEVQEDVSCVERGVPVAAGESSVIAFVVGCRTAEWDCEFGHSRRAPTKRRSTSMRSTEGSVAIAPPAADHAPDQQYSSVSAALSCPLALIVHSARGRFATWREGQSFRSPHN